MDLIIDHMLKSLIVGWAEEDLSVESLSSHSVVHDLVTSVLVAQLVEIGGDVLNSHLHERSGVSLCSLEASDLGG